MTSIGPQLPPVSGEKRKRHEDDLGDSPATASRSSSASKTRSHTPDSASKRQRVLGPTLPPASLDEKPPDSPNEKSEESSDDDGFGPSLPPTTTSAHNASTTNDSESVPSIETQVSTVAVRDEWMTLAPTSGDWSSRVDPTKLKNRKFNTGKGAKGPPQVAGGENAMWHETPAEKQARLQREMMGIKETKADGLLLQPAQNSEVTAEKLKHRIEATRGATLYNEHQKSNPREKEDDPSARAFDREKDIAGGMKINTTQRRDMLKKAADFGSRFSSAKYL